MVDDFEHSDDVENFNFYHNKITIDVKSGTILSGHSTYPFKGCNSKEWLCIFSDVFNMALPLKDYKNKATWEKNGFVFINKGQGVNYEGEDDGIFKILAYKEGVNGSFILFSEESGLISITILYEGRSETYWNVDKVGFNK